MGNSDVAASGVTRKIASLYPSELTLGGETLQLRLMEESDVEALLRFTRTR